MSQEYSVILKQYIHVNKLKYKLCISYKMIGYFGVNLQKVRIFQTNLLLVLSWHKQYKFNGNSRFNKKQEQTTVHPLQSLEQCFLLNLFPSIFRYCSKNVNMGRNGKKNLYFHYLAN